VSLSIDNQRVFLLLNVAVFVLMTAYVFGPVGVLDYVEYLHRVF